MADMYTGGSANFDEQTGKYKKPSNNRKVRRTREEEKAFDEARRAKKASTPAMAPKTYGGYDYFREIMKRREATTAKPKAETPEQLLEKKKAYDLRHEARKKAIRKRRGVVAPATLSPTTPTTSSSIGTMK